MRRIIAAGVAIGCLSGSLALGSIGVSWKNEGFVYDADFNLINGDHIVQLLWSATDPVAAGYAANLGTADYLDSSGNEYLLLQETVAASVDGKFQYNGEYLSGLTGGTDWDGSIEDGYVYSRVFSDTAIDVNTVYWQADVLYPLNNYRSSAEEPPPTSYQEYVILGPTDWVVADTQLVPEPTSIALFALGLATLGLRRRFRK